MVVQPGVPGSARVDHVDEPGPQEGDLLVRTLSVGLCGTDRHIVEGSHGCPPPGRPDLVIGHEAVGVVVAAGEQASFDSGALIVPTVRRADPVPCQACAAGRPDMCRNGRYRERGIKELHGFGSELFRVDGEHAVQIPRALGNVGTLVEPASIVAKAWDRIERTVAREVWQPERVLVTGAGPIGLLAAMMSVQRGHDTRVVDQVEVGPKPALVADLGASYHTDSIASLCADADVVIECTGAPRVVLEVLGCNARPGIVCLTGLSGDAAPHEVDLASLNRTLVLENDIVFGSVSASRDHYVDAADALGRCEPSWLDRMITRTVPLDGWVAGLGSDAEQIKTVVRIDETFGGFG
jgi:threonine dehydrogenase-like Zn-dependent dehydrogenase